MKTYCECQEFTKESLRGRLQNRIIIKVLLNFILPVRSAIEETKINRLIEGVFFET